MANGDTATLLVTALYRLPRKDADTVKTEGARLLAFVVPNTRNHQIKVAFAD